MFGLKKKHPQQRDYDTYLRTEFREEYKHHQKPSPAYLYGMRFFW